MPAAPACRQDSAFCRVTPPNASTGILARQAWRRVSMPVGVAVDDGFFEDRSEDGEGSLVCGGLKTSCGE